MPDHPRPDVLRHTAGIVSAHLKHNTIAADALPQLIQAVYQALSSLGTEAEVDTARPEPAVPVRKSVFPDYIICLEDGAKLKMLKRYLQKRFNLTPAAYRERWGLPSSYPMVAPNYARKRSDLAQQSGLGRRTMPEPPAEASPEAEVKQEEVARKPTPARSRRKSLADGAA